MYHTSTTAIVHAKYMWFSLMVVIITLLLPRAAQHARPGLIIEPPAVRGIFAAISRCGGPVRFPDDMNSKIPRPPTFTFFAFSAADLVQRALLQLIEVSRGRHCEIPAPVRAGWLLIWYNVRGSASEPELRHTGGVRRPSTTTRIT